MGVGGDLVAKMTIKGLNEYAVVLSKLGTESNEVGKKAIYAAAKIVADKMKSNLEEVVSSDATGELVKSMGIAPIKEDKQGNLNTKIGFDGYSGKPYKGFPKGTPNKLKARALESGTSKQGKTPFVRPAVNKIKKKAQAKMAEVIESEYKRIMK